MAWTRTLFVIPVMYQFHPQNLVPRRRRAMKKLSVLLSLITVLGLLLSACGGGAAPTAAPETTQEPSAPTEEAAPQEPAATLRIWADDTRTPILQGLADDFLAKYNVELVVEDL